MGEGSGHNLTISTSSSSASSSHFHHPNTNGSSGVTSPRNDFVVSQRTTDFEVSRVDSLSLEEQEIMANIQELQLHLMQLRAEQDEDSDDEPSTALIPGKSSSQLIVVSNSLPVILERVPQTGRWKATKTTGGLDKLMCLTGVRSDVNFLWVGWVGQHIPKHEHESVRRLLLQHNCLPVFLSSDVASKHSNFSSDVLWSLFHYVSEAPAADAATNPTYHASKPFSKQDWRAYESANESFADTIAEIYNEGDSVWIHDYHLMLLPSLLRQRIPPCHIGWFLHTPFPASEVYCRLPVRAELLRGVLQSDLVGFQTFDYERHFASTCERLLGVEFSHKGIRSTFGGVRDHFTSMGVFPIGISVEPFARAASSLPTLHRVNDLHRKFGTKRIILGVDRLDNIKGIPHKLLAMEQLLNRFPEWHNNVVFIQIGISSRSGGVDGGSWSSGSIAGNEEQADTANATAPGASPGKPPKSGASTSSEKAARSTGIGYDMSHQLEMSTQSYRNLLSQVNQLVGRINGTFGTLDYAPIHFIHQSVMQHEELCALYDLADVCLVTSTRDGMNLVSHEFIVCQQHFMRRKEERKKAARAAARAAAPPPPPGSTESEMTPETTTPQSPPPPQRLPVPSPQVSPTKILTEWEGEEGGPGVLIVSEFAGCSQSLNGALVVNPWNTEDVAMSIHQALGMVRAEREIRQQKLYRYVSSNTATSWSMQFLGELGDAVLQNKADSTQLPKLDLKQLVTSYRNAKNRVIILDYDRTLTPQNSLLPLAAVGPNFKSLLDTLSADESNTVFIVSARERKFIETWLQGVRVGVAAEDGYFYRMNLGNDREHWKTMSKFQYDASRGFSGTGVSGTAASSTDSLYETFSHNSRRSLSLGSLPPRYASSTGSSNPPSHALFAPAKSASSGSGSLFNDDTLDENEDSSWKDLVLPTLMNFTDRTPGSYIEDKESSLTWHYGDADPHFGSWQAKDLQIVLERQLIGTALEVYAGHNWVSVEHEGCTKAKVVEGVLKHLSLPQQVRKKQQREVDFVLCVCDDWTDDQMFQTLNTLVSESKERHEKKKQQAAAKESAKRSPSGSMTTATHSARGQRFSATGSTVSSLSRQSNSSTGSNTSQAGSSQRHLSSTAASGTQNRRKSEKQSRRRKTTTQGSMRSVAEDDDELEQARKVDEDNKVAFSRLQKVPVRMAEDVAVYTVVVGSDVQHSAGHHTSARAVDSLDDVRKVLKEFVDVSRQQKTSTTAAPTSATASTEATKGPEETPVATEEVATA
ncbi:hypothetical protein Poli38472_005109 [Pythium oligandrum]|uniref:Trehalose-phosphatase n=1 Tax=Pythium oligandrum TaxID=41045 RepID=A0A8K1FHA0_PYTOL|nr:hypothetical protein Poli38472_005109 [Pythium oligandrum]|eukprot:TMW62491.1 hypothetical protein Poli38472_005109 [Pythium oligandrum]